MILNMRTLNFRPRFLCCDNIHDSNMFSGENKFEVHIVDVLAVEIIAVEVLVKALKVEVLVVEVLAVEIIEVKVFAV